MAKTYQVQIMNSENRVLVVAQDAMKDKIEACIKGKINDDEQSEYYFGMLQYLYTSTELRNKAWIKVETSLSGEVYDMVPVSRDARLEKCNGI